MVRVIGLNGDISFFVFARDNKETDLGTSNVNIGVVSLLDLNTGKIVAFGDLISGEIVSVITGSGPMAGNFQISM